MIMAIHVWFSGILRRLLPKLHEHGILIGDLSYPHDPDDLEAKYMGLCRLGPESKVRRIGERWICGS
jgi:hypothetical protein